MNTKDHIRRQFILARQQLGSELRLQKSALITTHLTASAIWQQAYTVACYCAHRGEVYTHLLVEQAWQQRKGCYLPVIQPARKMYFLPYTPQSLLAPNRYGIAQPPWQAALIKPVEQLDLILVPTVAFDNSGIRLGAGAGYYDRALAFKRQQRAIKPLLLGLAYDFQATTALVSESWDVRLDGVVTESGLRLFEIQESEA